MNTMVESDFPGRRTSKGPLLAIIKTVIIKTVKNPEGLDISLEFWDSLVLCGRLPIASPFA